MAEAPCSGLEESEHDPKARWGTRRERVPGGRPGLGSRSPVCPFIHSFIHAFSMTEKVHVSGAPLGASWEGASRSCKEGPVSG